MAIYKKTFRNPNTRKLIRRTGRKFSIYKKPSYRSKQGSGIGKTVGGMVGRAFGSYIGLPNTGAKLGRKAGANLAKVLGYGDYYLANKKTLVPAGDTPPQFINNNREVRISHREYIKDITSGTTLGSNGTSFDISNGPFPINPGVSSTFPWLSAVAGNFECFRLNGMMFEFKTTSADALNSTNTALGTVVMATSYNAANTTFFSKQQMENYEFAQSCKPSESMCHYIECAKNQNVLSEMYVRLGEVPTGQSPQLYDVGYFNIATQGMQAAGINLGELWVTYDITLLKPKLGSGGAIAGDILYSHLKLTNATNISTSKLFGNRSDWETQPGYTVLMAPNPNDLFGANRISFRGSFNVGDIFMIYIVIYGTGGANIVFPSTSSTQNLVGVNLQQNAGTYQYSAPVDNSMVYTGIFRVTSTTGDITINWANAASVPTGITNGDIFLMQLPGAAA